MSILLGIKSILGRVLDIVPDVYARKSYSQEGEDVILNRILSGQGRGFYVDVGAYHPRRFSNTHLFYQRGWSGINIEPNPDAIRIFKAVRRRDINVCLGISDRAETLTYYNFEDPALNTFVEGLVKSRLENTPYKVLKTTPVRVERLADVLARYLPAGSKIDFLTVDVEGLDFAVLQSNDWERYRPRWVLAEAMGKSIEEALDGEIARFMNAKRYLLFAKTYNTLFFRSESEESNDPGGLDRLNRR